MTRPFFMTFGKANAIEFATSAATEQTVDRAEGAPKIMDLLLKYTLPEASQIAFRVMFCAPDLKCSAAARPSPIE